ncbi:MAG: PD-(D/E)XK nuclease family protein, partial [Hyphomicrobiales bacterium]|nr:PD-(D/E)XK nuclease family protein [Hyphomicrobiales bacterium]
MRGRGDALLALARALDDAPPVPRVSRPAPRPPVTLRPTRLGVTSIETLLRDPYAIHARHVLGLEPLPEFRDAAEAAEIGEAWHAAIAAYGRHFPAGPPADAPAQFRSRLAAAFATLLDDDAFAILREQEIERASRAFLAWDASRRRDAGHVAVEAGGKLALTLDDGSAFALVARADRLERGLDGRISAFDYKTGEAPSKKMVGLYSLQLPLESAIAARGGFGPEVEGEPGALAYLKIGGAKIFEERPVADDSAAAAETALARTTVALSRYRSPDAGYVSRVAPFKKDAAGDYDHLARVREWSAGDGPDEDGEDEG